MQHVAGCGTDIEELDRFERIFSREQNGLPGLIIDVFSDEEVSINLSKDALLKFTLGFSCKEAFFKALGSGWTSGGAFWQDIELLFDRNNPVVYKIRLNGFALKFFNDKGYKNIDSSFSQNDRYVVFNIVLLK